MFSSLRGLVAALGVATVMSSATARAATTPARFRSPGAGTKLIPGQTLRIAWDRPPTDPDDEEMELLLSLDGGASFPIRLSRDLSLDRTSLSWRVPAFASPNARLAIRIGRDGDSSEERIALVSETFEIAAVRSGATDAVYRVRDEWRLEEALDAPPPAAVIPRPDWKSQHSECLHAGLRPSLAAGSRPAPIRTNSAHAIAPRARHSDSPSLASSAASPPGSAAAPLRL